MHDRPRYPSSVPRGTDRTRPDLVFAGRTALITGGASGIGRALGEALVGCGATVTLTDVDGEAVERIAAEIRERFDVKSVVARPLDVTDRDQFAATVAEVGDLDLLVNNAGISMGGPTHELTGAHWDRVIDVNVRGVVNGLLAAYPAMVERGGGQIVNVASAAGLAAPPFVTAYAATKHAVVGLSTGLRAEAALHGVTISALCPGSVETAILDRTPPEDLPATASAPVTARQYLAVVRQKPVPADLFARQALVQIARGKGVIVVPVAARSLWYLHRLSPALMDRVGLLIARRVDEALVRPGPGSAASS